MYTTPEVGASQWTQILSSISELLVSDPVGGLFSILLSLVVFFLMLIGTTWAIVKIIRSKREPINVTIFHEEIFTRNVLDMIKKLVALNGERDRLSRRHEHISEHAIVRDQLTLVEGAQQEVRNILLVDVTDRIIKDYPEHEEAAAETRVYFRYEHSIDLLMNELFTYFRRAAKENHMVDKTEKEFFDYITTKMDRLYKLSQHSIHSQAKGSQTVEMVVSLLESNWKTIEPIYRRLFTEMRNVATRYQEKIRQEETEYEKRWSDFISKIPDMLMNGVTTKS